MRKVMVLLLMIPFLSLLSAQDEFNPDSVPVVDGKVVFHVEIKNDLTKDIVRERVKSYLNGRMDPYQGDFIIDNEDSSICRITDYIVISSSAFHVFAMYMTYRLSFEYRDNLCVITIQNIHFMEKEDFEYKEKKQPHMTREIYMDEYSGEDIMIDKKYKLVMNPNASRRVTVASIGRINDIVRDIRFSLYRK